VKIIFYLFLCCLLSACGQSKRLSGANDSKRFLGLDSGKEIILVNGVLIRLGRDFVAYGKYKIEDSFDEKTFISKYRLIKSDKQDTHFFEEESSKIIWFKINKNMKRFDFFDSKNESSRIIWIDDSEGFIFVENAKW
jgi:hypothetical protein